MASSEAHKLYMKEYYAKNRKKVLATNERWRSNNKELHLERAREYHNANKDAINQRRRDHRKENPEHYAGLRRAREYGLMPVEVEMMAQSQGGRCAICEDKAPLVVDHCHELEYVRALLCNRCNAAIGFLKDDPERAKKAVKYLEKHALMKAKAVQAKAGVPAEQQGAQ